MFLFYTWIQDSEGWREACLSLTAWGCAITMEGWEDGTRNYAIYPAAWQIATWMTAIAIGIAMTTIREEASSTGWTAWISSATCCSMGIALGISAAMC